MAGPTHVVVKLPANSGVNRDTVQMHFDFANPSATVENSINAFFNSVASPNVDTMASFLSPWLSRGTNQMVVEQYHITATTGSHAPMGPPFQTDMITLANTLNSPAPQECCIALSYHAINDTIPEHAPGSRPKSRYRGRIYFGPTVTAAFDSDPTSHRLRVKASTISFMVNALKALLVAEPTWGVWSKVDGLIRPIVAGWIDDDFDVQRRRGTDPVARVTWP
jgi:hypothetical protein